jgi:hypothetical protein
MVDVVAPGEIRTTERFEKISLRDVQAVHHIDERVDL